MPTLTYNVKVGSRAGVSPDYKNPALRLSEIDSNRQNRLETYTVHGSTSKFGWESEVESLDSFGVLSASYMSFIKDNSSVSAISGYGFLPTSEKIKIKHYLPVSASVYKRDGDSNTIYIQYGNTKDDKYYIGTTRVGDLDHIEEDSHNHGINVEEVGELAIEISHIVIPEEKTKTSSDKIIKLDYYPVTNVRVDGTTDYEVNQYSGIVINKTGSPTTIKYNPTPLVIVHSGPATYLHSIDPAITLNLLEINNPNTDNITSVDNVINSKTDFFIETTGPISIDGKTYLPGAKHLIPKGRYEVVQANSEWTTNINQKITSSDVSVVDDIQSKIIERYRMNGANPISYESVANGDVYKQREISSNSYRVLEVVVDDKDRRVILPHLTTPGSISVQRVGYQNSRDSIGDYEHDAVGTLKFQAKGRYIITYLPITKENIGESDFTRLRAIAAELGLYQKQIKVYCGTDKQGSVEYLNVDNPIIIGRNNG